LQGAFLDHARLALSRAAEAIQAARRAARPAKAVFSVGFLTGQEVDWLPHVTRILRAELPTIEFKLTSLYSPDLGDALQSGEIDLGFLRVEPRPDVTYRVIAEEPLVAILSSDHRLATQAGIDPHDLQDEAFVGVSDVPHVLRSVVDDYLQHWRRRSSAQPPYRQFRDGHFPGRLYPRHCPGSRLCRTLPLWAGAAVAISPRPISNL
jgi:LysR family hca operon transcriptional activator